MAFRRLSSHRVPALLAAVLLILAQPAHRASAQKCFPQGPEAMRNQLIMSQVNPGTPEDLFLNPSLQHMVKDWSGAALKAAMAWPKAKACPAPAHGRCAARAAYACPRTRHGSLGACGCTGRPLWARPLSSFGWGGGCCLRCLCPLSGVCVIRFECCLLSRVCSCSLYFVRCLHR